MQYNAYVLVATNPNTTIDTFKRLADVPGVKSAYHTTGRWDAVLYVEGKEFHDIPKMICEKIRHLNGVTHTETLFAFNEL